jgi:hypothetical protein
VAVPLSGDFLAFYVSVSGNMESRSLGQRHKSWPVNAVRFTHSFVLAILGLTYRLADEGHLAWAGLQIPSILPEPNPMIPAIVLLPLPQDTK